jgi:hypothetical protein
MAANIIYNISSFQGKSLFYEQTKQFNALRNMTITCSNITKCEQSSRANGRATHNPKGIGQPKQSPFMSRSEEPHPPMIVAELEINKQPGLST